MKQLKTYTTAPLPFMGQKRKFYSHLKKVLQQFPADATFIDLFGGSGLLSQFVKQLLPKARVIYNDYDNYKQRIDHIPTTNKILAQVRELLVDYPKDKSLTPSLKQAVINIFEKASEKGFVDYITLSSSLLFSMNYATTLSEFAKHTMYNRITSKEYNADDYLDGVEIESDDFMTLFEKNKNLSNVVFLVDPPYLSTDVKVYQNYWSMKEYLNVLKVVVDHPYIYFTSNKSNIIELCEWIDTATLKSNPFKDAETVKLSTTTGYNSSYTDIMIFKHYSTT